MFDAVLNLNSWFLFFALYLVVGFILAKDVYGFVPKLMSSIGWPIEFTQKLFGTKSLPYLFLFPNIPHIWTLYVSSIVHELWLFCDRWNKYQL